jgi:GNAT superfamily N-acetyltransferase
MDETEWNVSALFTVRRAIPADLDALAALIDEFARGHPAEHYPRSMAVMEEAYFGPHPISHMLVAERRGEPVGFGGWHEVFDRFWAMYGSELNGLYVKPCYRGREVAPAIIAAICADIRREGGCFLRGTYADKVGRLYERVAVGSAQHEGHVSASAFHIVADLAGHPPRRLLRGLPDKRLNSAAPRDAAAG